MKTKKLLLFLTIALLIISFSFAEASDEFGVEGEWYVTALYTERCRSVSPDEEGSFCISLEGEPEQIIHADGAFYEDGKYQGTLVPYDISENARLFYLLEDGGTFSGYLFLLEDDSWKYHYLFNTAKYLLHDGKMIPATDGNKSEYQISGNTMFLINDDTYVKGSIASYGAKAFACILDVDPVEHDYGNGTVRSWGYPMYLFISTDLK